MTILSWFFQNQIHKSRDGYYINHDNLAGATPQDRHKLIFYYIASQVPEKLEPEDLKVFQAEKYRKVYTYEGLFAFAACTLFSLRFRGAGSDINPRHITNLALFLLGNAGVFYFSQSLTHNLIEPSFVAHNKVVGHLSDKYQFTVYDFAQAKREAYLKQLKSQFRRQLPHVNTPATSEKLF